MNKHKHTPKTGGQKRYGMWRNTLFMLRLAWGAGEKKVPLLCLLSAALAVGTNLVNLYVAPSILSVLENHAPLRELLITIAVFAALLILVTGGANYINANTMYGRISVRTQIIYLLDRKAATTSYPNLSNKHFCDLLQQSSTYVSANSSATEAVWKTLTDLTAAVAGFAIYVALLSTVQPWLFLITLVTTLIGYLITNRLNEYGYRHREEDAECVRHLTYLTSGITDPVSGKDIRLFGLIPWFDELFAKGMRAYVAFQNRAEGVYLWGSIADLALTLLRNGIAYAYLIRLAVGNSIGVAEFLLYFSAVSGFAEWVTQILSSLSTLRKQSLDISTVRECLDFDEPFRLTGGERLKPDPSGAYEIRLADVSYRYPNQEADALSHIDLTLRPGEKLAVVGLNGAGKTTLVKLICGLLDPTEGQVLLNGRDIRTYNRVDYYLLFSAVFQDFSLLPDTITTNIAQDADHPDRALVRQCLKHADLTEKVDSLKQGEDTLLCRDVYEDAVMLSGGETQRLMLARALYKRAPIIILDEPTAALDPIAESDLYRQYSDMTRGKSSVFISHRLASTRFCDRIILIGDGSILEAGTHEELLARNGKYAELFEIQSKYYREGDERDAAEAKTHANP